MDQWRLLRQAPWVLPAARALLVWWTVSAGFPSPITTCRLQTEARVRIIDTLSLRGGGRVYKTYATVPADPHSIALLILRHAQLPASDTLIGHASQSWDGPDALTRLHVQGQST